MSRKSVRTCRILCLHLYARSVWPEIWTKNFSGSYIYTCTHSREELTRTQPPHLALGRRKELWYQTHTASIFPSPAQTDQYDNHGLLCILYMYCPVRQFQPVCCKSEKKAKKIPQYLFHWDVLYTDIGDNFQSMCNLQITAALDVTELSHWSIPNNL